MAQTWITPLNFSDGQVLTAGSLMLFPQLYTFEEYLSSSPTSGTNYQTVGSLYMSGGVFSKELNVAYFVKGAATANSTSCPIRLFMSGAGLGGGSQIREITYTANDDDMIIANAMVNIPSGAGWIPGSGAALFLDIKTNQSLNNVTGHLTVWSRGKP